MPEESLPVKFVVSDAYKAEKSSYPIRWLIMMVSTISACFLAIIVIHDHGKKSIRIIPRKAFSWDSHKKSYNHSQ